MINQPNLNTELRPRLINSIKTGFDIVASHIWLIIPPMVLDLFLWFGPHIRIKSILTPMIQNLQIPAQLQNSNNAQVFTNFKEVYLELVERYNLFSAFHTLPVGIPSQLSNRAPIINPIGSPLIFEATTTSSAFLLWVVLSLAGLIACSFYFNLISKATARVEAHPSDAGTIGWQTLQLLYLALLCLAFILILIFPGLTLVSFLSLVSPALGQVALFLAGLLIIWIVTPMLFTPQVIFTQHQPVIKALLSSIRIVRFVLPTTGLFFMTLLILSQGLNMLWLVPADNSWLTLIGIFGHALVNTSLIAAIFVYYRDGVKWVESIIQQNNLTPKNTSSVS